jgi:hypothetical protein
VPPAPELLEGAPPRLLALLLALRMCGYWAPLLLLFAFIMFSSGVYAPYPPSALAAEVYSATDPPLVLAMLLNSLLRWGPWECAVDPPAEAPGRLELCRNTFFGGKRRS